MKRNIIAGIIVAGIAMSASAEKPAVTEAKLATAEPGVANALALEIQPQRSSYTAGSQLLVDISAKVGGDLNEKLEREVGGEVTVRMRPKELLVSSN